MTASLLKDNHIAKCPDSHFFDRKTMAFFGDTMKNYGVTSYDENTWELYRRHAVKHGMQKSAYFDKVTFAQVWPSVD